MADPAKVGKPWGAEELDAIVADYFDMLAAELAGAKYVKSRHAAKLMSEIGRTHRSVEFKHQNISAVLDELGLPWIPGYIPKRNYQSAIFPAIERYLDAHPSVLNHVTSEDRPFDQPSDLFVDPPPKLHEARPPVALQRLVRKFDPVLRDSRNRTLGVAGEEFVLTVERKRLAQADQHRLAERVKWVASEDGDGAGYDILSFDSSGRERLIEVKTTNGAARTPFFITRNECAVAASRPEHWLLYRVHDFAFSPRIFVLRPPLESFAVLAPETWRVSF